MKRLLLILALSALISNYALADASTYLNFTAVNGPATIALVQYNTNMGCSIQIFLQYSTDNCATWNTYTIGDTLSLASGSKIFFKALNTNGAFSTKCRYDHWITGLCFTMTGTVAADGNIMSLLDETMSSTTVPKYGFTYLFENCTSLTQAPELPATNLDTLCYAGMFEGCTSLKSAPALPATTLAPFCYWCMFLKCTSLASAPALSATTLAPSCYRAMFSDCSSLASAPALSATTLAPFCYGGMFSDCSSLTSAPALPATTLAPSCYFGMFAGTSLTQAPLLPATTLADSCYYAMFENCTLVSAPALPATTLAPSCYFGMFAGTSLTQAPLLPATTLADSCYYEMFKYCTLVSAPALPATTLAPHCYCNMFNTCVSLVSPPVLPATTLATNCYSLMFSDCYSLTQLPDLPADSLPSECYMGMFAGCISLNVNSEGPGKEWSIQASYVDSLSLTDMFARTAGTMNGTPSTNTSYYIPSHVECTDTSEADVIYYCKDEIQSVPVYSYNLIITRSGSTDTVDINFANDTSFVMNRLPRATHIIDSVTGNTTTVTITINHSASAADANDVNVHLEHLEPQSAYHLTLRLLNARGAELERYECCFVTAAPIDVPTALEDCHADTRDLFFPSADTDVYTIDGRYLGKYHDSLPPAIYIMWEDGKAHKFAKIR